MDPSDQRTIACLAIVLGPPDEQANHCLNSLQNTLHERVQRVELGTDADRMTHLQHSLQGLIGPDTVTLVVQCGTAGQAHPDLGALKDVLDRLSGKTGRTRVNAPVVVCSGEGLQAEACIARVVQTRQQVHDAITRSGGTPTPTPVLLDAPHTPPGADAVRQLVAGPPIGMLLIKLGLMDDQDRDLLEELVFFMANRPLLSVQFTPLQDAIDTVTDIHRERGTPHTAYVILCETARETEVNGLCAALLKSGIRALTHTHGTDRRSLCGIARGAAMNYESALFQHDLRYLDMLKDWLSDPLHHRGDSSALFRYMARVLAMSRDEVCDDIDLRFADRDLLVLPPLPARNIGRMEIVNCPIGHIRGLPGTLLYLTIEHFSLVYVDIDPREVPFLKRLDLRGIGLAQVPSWVDELPDGVEKLFADPPYEESSPDSDTDTDTDTAPEDDPPPPPAGSPRHHTVSIEEALRHWSDTPALHATDPDWQRLERLPGADMFASLLVKLGKSRKFATTAQGIRIANVLGDMRKDLALARLVMETCEDADGTCIDRASLTWHFIELVRESHALLQRRPIVLPDIVEQARQVLRRTLLMDRANEKIKQVRADYVARGLDPENVEEIEIVLAYLQWSEGALALRSNPYAEFTRSAISHVEMREVSRAIREIQSFENAQFEVFLADWKPWRDVLSELAPERMLAIEQACSDTDGIDAIARKELAQLGAPNADTAFVSNADRSRVSDAIRRGGVIALTREFLQAQGLIDLLQPRWRQT